MADKNTYYDCECKCYEDHTIICKTCEEWMDKVEKTIQEHGVDEFTYTTKSKRWSKPKHNTK